MSEVRVQLFNRLELFIGGKAYSIRNEKARELLALLLIYKGGPMKKRFAAQKLWPDTKQERAMDELYRLMSFWRHDSTLSQYCPLQSRSGELLIDVSNISCDLFEFVKCAASNNVEDWVHAIEFYQSGLLHREYYEWTTEAGLLYEVQYLNVLDRLIEHYQASGNVVQAAYYSEKQQRL